MSPMSAEQKLKMKKTRQKGAKCELATQKLLEGQGYTIHRARPCVAWIAGKPISIQHDIFTYFDMIAKKAGTQTRWIQVTMGTHKSDKVKRILQFPVWNSEDSIEIWVYDDKYNPRIFRRTGNFGKFIEWGSFIKGEWHQVDWSNKEEIEIK